MHRVIPRISNNRARKTMIYEIRAHDCSWTLRLETIQRYIPGVLRFPRKRGHHFGFPPQATIGIEGVVKENILVKYARVPAKEYFRCLRGLMDSIEEAENNNTVRDQSPLLRTLEKSWRRHGGDAFRMLVDFVCLANLVHDVNFRGSTALKAELSDFFLNHAGSICPSVPLDLCLQYVDSCPESDFEPCMERLLVKLSPHQRLELEEKCGRVRLYYTQKISKKVMGYMRRRGDSNRTSQPTPMMGPYPHPRNGFAINQRGRRRHPDHCATGSVARSIPAARFIEQGISLSDIARNGGRVRLPGRGQQSPNQDPLRRYRS